MIKYIYADQLNHFPKLKATMLKDRAIQFRDRLKWEVTVDENGFETDQYDILNPLYVIWENNDGSHGGSIRFMPTIGKTMVNDFFVHLSGRKIASPHIWETTRFCVSPHVKDSNKVATFLMTAGAQFGVAHGLSHSVGVFDARMVRIYRRLGWEPKILGTEGKGREAISTGVWEFSQQVLKNLCTRAGISTDVSSYWYTRAFEDTDMPIRAA